MNIKIREVEDSGNIEKERLVLNVDTCTLMEVHDTQVVTVNTD